MTEFEGRKDYPLPFMARALEFMETPDREKTEALCLDAVRLDGWLFRHVPDRLKTPEICLEAVRSWGGALRRIPSGTAGQELHLEAVRSNAFALDDVPPAARTAEVCMAAVKAGSWAMRYVPEELKTPELCMEALLGGAGIDDVPERLRTPEFCMEAFRRDAGASEGAPLDPDFVLDAVKRKPGRLRLLPEGMRTPEICRAAVRNWGGTLGLVPEKLKTPALCAEAVHVCGEALQFVPDRLKTPALCLAAVRHSGRALRWAPEALKTPALCLSAAGNDGWALEYVPEELKTEEMCLRAAGRTPAALKWTPERLKTEKVRETAARRREQTAYPVPPRLPFAVPVSRRELEASVRRAVPDIPEGAESSALLLLEDGSAVPLPDSGPVPARRLFLPLVAVWRGACIVLHSVLSGAPVGHASVWIAGLNSTAVDLMRAGGVDMDGRRQKPETEGEPPVPVLDRKTACAVFAAKLRADVPGLDSLVRRINALLGGRIVSGPANLRALLPGSPTATACVLAGRDGAGAAAMACAACLPEGAEPVFVNGSWHAEHPGRLLNTWLHETAHLLLPGGAGHCRRFWVWTAMLGREAGRSGLFRNRSGGVRWDSPRRGVSKALAWLEEGKEEAIAQALAEYRRMPRAPMRDPAVRRLAQRRERIAAVRRRIAAGERREEAGRRRRR